MKHKKLIAALLLTLFTTPLLTPLSMAKGSSVRVSTPRVSSPVRSSTPKANTISNSTGSLNLLIRLLLKVVQIVAALSLRRF